MSGATPAPAQVSDHGSAAYRVIEAAQAALAGEHACVYGYGIVGAHLSGDAQDRARRALSVHESRRDTLHDHLVALDVVPEAARPAYTLPFVVEDEQSARQLAGVLEQRLAAVYADLAGSGAEQHLREFAADALVDAAVRRTRWTGQITAFPGLDERGSG